jgi:hypothetical protein
LNLNEWEQKFLLSCINEDGTVEDMEHCLTRQGSAANVDVIGHSNGWTALFFASEMNDVKKVQFLLDYGANVYAEDIYNRLPFQVAGGKEVMQLFCDYDEDGYTAAQLITLDNNNNNTTRTTTSTDALARRRVIPDTNYILSSSSDSSSDDNKNNDPALVPLLLLQDEMAELRTDVDALRKKLGRVVHDLQKSSNSSSHTTRQYYSVKELVLVVVVVMVVQYIIIMIMTSSTTTTMMYSKSNNNNNPSGVELREF